MAGPARAAHPRHDVDVLVLFSLSFIYLMPTLASENLGMKTRSLAYGLLVASFALGAASAPCRSAAVLVGRSKPRIVRVGLASFGVLLSVFRLGPRAGSRLSGCVRRRPVLLRRGDVAVDDPPGPPL